MHKQSERYPGFDLIFRSVHKDRSANKLNRTFWMERTALNNVVSFDFLSLLELFQNLT